MRVLYSISGLLLLSVPTIAFASDCTGVATGLVPLNDIVPLDVSGQPSRDGSVVLLSIGMSNASLEFRKFIRFANDHPDVDQDNLVIINGARSGGAAHRWVSPDLEFYEKVRMEALAPQGLSEAQVQAVWLKVATSNPEISLPQPDANAFELTAAIGDISRALGIRYPNLQLVFLSSRIYAGYASEALNPEPFAYETGFAAKG